MQHLYIHTNLSNATPCIYINLTNATPCIYIWILPMQHPVYTYEPYQCNTLYIHMNLTDTHAEPRIPLVTLKLTRTRDVPAVQRDGHEVSVVGAAEFALWMSWRCVCVTRVTLRVPALLPTAIVLPGTAGISKHIHRTLLQESLLLLVLFVGDTAMGPVAGGFVINIEGSAYVNTGIIYLLWLIPLCL